MASPTVGIDPQALIDTRQSDIALLGITLPQGDTMVEAYRVYVGTDAEPFGRPLYQAVPATDIPALLTHMLHIYQGNRGTPDESFGAFADRYALADLRQLFDQPSLAQSQTYV